ncbi:MAG: MaoC family dehydratase [Deltaproteobacteria bacterium]|nr:MaoC family dehydratase [bacterium]MCB9476240.1 MaoC family dehydratase [Deltaproteobacteria bacterium]MCB9489887.1 MaoC family dehydratase [Deltaproteobacteria bacterium]
MPITRHVYGRKLDDFKEGDIYRHPWEVTVDDGLLGVVAASFMESSPVYFSDHFAQALGFTSRVVHPLVLLNLGLSFSVLDVSEQAIAHLAYIDVRYPNPCYVGDSVTAASEVVGTKMSGSGDKGTVHVITTLWNQNNVPVCIFERKALIRAGAVEGSPRKPVSITVPTSGEHYPKMIEDLDFANERGVAAFDGYYEDFFEGRIFVHDTGRTVGDSEHMQLTTLFRNTHPLHFDAEYCKENSFTKDRVVYGGLVLGFTHACAARDTGGQVIWTDGYDNGAHPAPTLAGDTLMAAQKVLKKEDVNDHLGKVTFRLVGVKNTDPQKLLDAGKDLWTAERDKDKDAKVKEKVVEIDRTVFVRKKPL